MTHTYAAILLHKSCSQWVQLWTVVSDSSGQMKLTVLRCTSWTAVRARIGDALPRWKDKIVTHSVFDVSQRLLR